MLQCNLMLVKIQFQCLSCKIRTFPTYDAIIRKCLWNRDVFHHIKLRLHAACVRLVLLYALGVSINESSRSFWKIKWRRITGCKWSDNSGIMESCLGKSKQGKFIHRFFCRLSKRFHHLSRIVAEPTPFPNARVSPKQKKVYFPKEWTLMKKETELCKRLTSGRLCTSFGTDGGQSEWAAQNVANLCENAMIHSPEVSRK